MGVKGSWWRGGWNQKYADNFNNIFRKENELKKDELKKDDKINLSGKTDFGKSFVEENGSEFEVVKVQTWSEHQVLLRTIKENCEIGLIWINLYPESQNFKIHKD